MTTRRHKRAEVRGKGFEESFAIFNSDELIYLE